MSDDSDSKTCLGCHKVFQRPRHLDRDSWQRRMYCCRTCWRSTVTAETRRKDAEKKERAALREKQRAESRRLRDQLAAKKRAIKTSRTKAEQRGIVRTEATDYSSPITLPKLRFQTLPFETDNAPAKSEPLRMAVRRKYSNPESDSEPKAPERAQG